MRHTLTRRPRGGYTLVELLVACALTVLIMAVLATAFQTGLSTFSHLKSTVGLSEQLRSAETVIRRDIEATHLEDDQGLPVRVSKSSTPPRRGYFEVVHSSADLPFGNPVASPYIVEGTEDGVLSYRATDHALFFTSKLRGNSPQEVYVGEGPVAGDPELADYAPAGAFVGQWAEIGLFLVPNNVMTIDDAGATGTQLKLHSLVRCQRVLATSPQELLLSGANTTPTMWRNAFFQASISTQTFPATAPASGTRARVNDPGMLVTRANRLGHDATSPTTAIMPANFGTLRSTTQSGSGTDILVTNVVSMQIRVMDSSGMFKNKMTEVVTNPVPPALPAPVTYLSATVAAEGYRLDTSALGTVQVRAIQIRLRVYDTKNHLTRQMTMTFDL